MSDLFIIAAGKGSRMGGHLPKALVPIEGSKPCLTLTLDRIHDYFRNIYIVTNVVLDEEWNQYFDELFGVYPSMSRHVHQIRIHSGLGDGHAVMEALQDAATYVADPEDEVVIAWGDVYFSGAGIIDELLSQPMNGAGLIPAVREDNPYVTLLVDRNLQCVSADFSKYGENHQTGFHDQSVFRFRREPLEDALKTLHASLWKNGRYMTPGGELSTLFTFHYLFNKGTPVEVYETNYPTASFNTPEEAQRIINGLEETT